VPPHLHLRRATTRAAAASCAAPAPAPAPAPAQGNYSVAAATVPPPLHLHRATTATMRAPPPPRPCPQPRGAAADARRGSTRSDVSGASSRLSASPRGPSNEAQASPRRPTAAGHARDATGAVRSTPSWPGCCSAAAGLRLCRSGSVSAALVPDLEARARPKPNSRDSRGVEEIEQLCSHHRKLGMPASVFFSFLLVPPLLPSLSPSPPPFL